ncbi:hypothetical protein AQ708_29010 [Burkholderia pseudomallei]|uniref:type II toxin-antitoxin system RelB family antitoxin n=1 Tax=Burkholderia pseudomallei TaxID=28450 RepID=UPI0009757D21|nr:hypothetical protein [Burkholderia pseudomallei]OMQ54913.1 hypothetical protein AQ708_29010 [Burkholderia pseudomallei]CAJ6802058.1 Uncharacterised protein [Burkholderia pseudomallei]
MAHALDMIDQHTLEQLVQANSVRGANVIAQAGGWGVVIQYGMTERVLAVRRGHVRIWPKLDTLVAFLRRLGIARFQVDATSYDAAAKPARARVDAAERMRHAHEAAAYDRWLREQVQASLDDPRPSIPHEQVQQEMAVKKAALRKRLARAGGKV